MRDIKSSAPEYSVPFHSLRVPHNGSELLIPCTKGQSSRKNWPFAPDNLDELRT